MYSWNISHIQQGSLQHHEECKHNLRIAPELFPKDTLSYSRAFDFRIYFTANAHELDHVQQPFAVLVEALQKDNSLKLL